MVNRKFVGPVRPGISEEIFRETGISVRKFVGPVRPETDESFFRRTGISRSRAESQIQAQAKEQARIRDELEARKRAEEQARAEKIKATLRADQQARQKAEQRIREIKREKSGLEKSNLILQQRQLLLRRKIEKEKPIARVLRFVKPTKEVKVAQALTIAGQTISLVLAFKDLPKTAKAIVQNPELLKSIPSAIKGELIDFKRLIMVSPTEAFVKVGTEIILLKGTGKAFSIAGKLTGRATARLSPKFVGKAKVGETLKITTKAGKKIDLKVVGRIGSKSLPREPIKKQVLRAGKRALPVSAQADELVGFIKRRRIIRKPILNEARFSRPTKKLLSKFDRGKISKKQLTKLDKLINKQSGKGILERSFFADPEARIRPSRLGIEKEASIIDVIRGDVTFRKQKPQILVFDKVRVEKFPKNFNKIKNKLTTGKSLTKPEADKLLQFQLKTSGKFKPLGFLSGEAELTLAPKEIIKRGKKVGVTIINGRKVPIFETKVLKPSKKLTKSISLARKGKLTKKQLKNLDKTLKKKTGFNFGLSRPKKSVKRISIKRIGATTISRAPKRKPRISKLPSRPRKISRVKRPSRPSRPSKPSRPGKPSKPSKPSKLSRPSKPSRPGKPSKPSKPSKPARVGRPAKPSRPAKIIRIKIIKRKKKKIRKFIGYDVFGRRLKGRKIKGKKRKVVWIKLNVKPLSKKNALNRGAYAIDHSVARTFKIKRVRKVKRVGKITKKEGKYFKKTRKKYRAFKIRKGVKKPIVRKFIERKGKYLIDQPGEKRGLKLHKIAKQLKGQPIRIKKIKVLKKPRLTPIKLQQVRLKNLKKARNKLNLMRKSKQKIISRIKRVRVKSIKRSPARRSIRKSPQRITKSKPKSIKQKRFIKGSKEAKQFMAKLRGMKGK